MNHLPSNLIEAGLALKPGVLFSTFNTLHQFPNVDVVSRDKHVLHLLQQHQGNPNFGNIIEVADIAVAHRMPGSRRMALNLGYRAFEQMADVIEQGNVESSVLTSSYIRCSSDVVANGKTWAVGELRKFDLETYRRRPEWQCLADSVMRSHCERRSTLAVLCHRLDNGRRITHGALHIASDNAEVLQRWDADYFHGRNLEKSRRVMDVATALLSRARAYNRRVVAKNDGDGWQILDPQFKLPAK